VLVENSAALRTKGADVVLGGLVEAGYTCWPLVVGACAIGAPHERKRVFIVAHTSSAGCEGGRLERILDAERPALGRDVDGFNGTVEHPEGTRLEGFGKRLPRRWPAGPVEPQGAWEPARTVKQQVGGRADGFSRRLAERRRKRELEALGNAVVPQMAEALGRAVLAIEARRGAVENDLRELLG
jgi:DNA (cytosine-5)-methyltransferase 1